MSFQPFGMTLDAGKNARYSHILSLRGGNVTTLDLFDIAGAATGAWTGAVPYGGSGALFTTGSCITYDPATAYAYLNQNGGQAFYRFDGRNRVLEQWAQLRYAQGAAVVGARMATSLFVDSSGAPKLALPLVLRSSGTELFQTIAQR